MYVSTWIVMLVKGACSECGGGGGRGKGKSRAFCIIIRWFVCLWCVGNDWWRKLGHEVVHSESFIINNYNYSITTLPNRREYNTIWWTMNDAPIIGIIFLYIIKPPLLCFVVLICLSLVYTLVLHDYIHPLLCFVLICLSLVYDIYSLL